MIGGVFVLVGLVAIALAAPWWVAVGLALVGVVVLVTS